MPTKQARLVGDINGIALELLDENIQSFLLARLPDTRTKNCRVIIGGSNVLAKARWAFKVLKRRGYDIFVDDSIRIDQLISDVQVGERTGINAGDIRKLVDYLQFQWIGLDIRIEIGQLLSRLSSRNGRGGGLNGFRIVETAVYTNMLDGIEAKNIQIKKLLMENEFLRTQLSHRPAESIGF